MLRWNLKELQLVDEESRQKSKGKEIIIKSSLYNFETYDPTWSIGETENEERKSKIKLVMEGCFIIIWTGKKLSPLLIIPDKS